MHSALKRSARPVNERRSITRNDDDYFPPPRAADGKLTDFDDSRLSHSPHGTASAL